MDKLFYSSQIFSFFTKRFFSLHLIYKLFSYVKSWHCVDFFARANLFNLFNLVNVNRLKNLFLRRVGCNRLWNEIFKMVDVGLIGFSNYFVFEKTSYLECSFLSMFLLEVYLFEFDLYLLDIAFNLNSIKILTSNYEHYLLSSKRFSNDITYFNSNFFPSRIDKTLINSVNLKNFNSYVIMNFYNNFSSKFVNGFFFLFFVRYFYFLRYKSQLIIAFKGTFNLFSFLKSKIISFVRSNLNVDLRFSSVSLVTFFLGYNIKSNLVKFNSENNIAFFNENYSFPSSTNDIIKFLSLKLEKLKSKINIEIGRAHV